jgi:hypothetical protein
MQRDLRKFNPRHMRRSGEERVSDDPEQVKLIAEHLS